MPPKSVPKCQNCEATQSPQWHKQEAGQMFCQECHQKKAKLAEEAATAAEQPEEQQQEDKAAADMPSAEDDTNSIATSSQTERTDTASSRMVSSDEKRLRKSTRSTRFKARSITSHANGQANASAVAGAGAANGGGATPSNAKANYKARSRRSIYKKTPFKTPTEPAATRTVQYVFYKGSYIQVGDIVSLVDAEENVYYAQIRGLLVDEYCEKSAFLTWLIPTTESPPPVQGFDAATYLIGPDEQLPRKLSYLEFVMHAPSDYYLDRTQPFPVPDNMNYDSRPGYIWTNLKEYKRPTDVKVETDEE